ncbi:unnamed protein product, partial [Polarella glacialis]
GGGLGLGLGALGSPWPGLGSLGLQQPQVGLAGLLGSAAPAASTAGMSDETVANLLMAWYHSGYQTGQYAARQGK